jgi:hypothetical protein
MMFVSHLVGGKRNCVTKVMGSHKTLPPVLNLGVLRILNSRLGNFHCFRKYRD